MHKQFTIAMYDNIDILRTQYQIKMDPHNALKTRVVSAFFRFSKEING